jgi:hypothetical protein
VLRAGGAPSTAEGSGADGAFLGFLSSAPSFFPFPESLPSFLASSVVLTKA